jgi:hypothetical protein
MKSRIIAIQCFVLTLLALQAAGAQVREPTVSRDSIWLETVKRGDMVREVRAPGELLGEAPGKTGALRAVLKVPAEQATDIKVGQAARIDTGRGGAAGTVASRGSAPVDGTVEVEVKLSDSLPDGTSAGTQVDGTIEIERLQNVLYVGRPIAGNAGGTAMLFRLEPDGAHAARVPVSFGRASVKVIEIREGLREGDKVILSDMSAWKTSARIRLE